MRIHYRIIYCLLVTLALAPILATAQSGFAREPLWASKDPAYAGESIHIHAALYNRSTSSLATTYSLFDQGSLIGTQAIELQGGESRIISIPWKATAGPHLFSAELRGGTLQNPVSTETPVALSISPPPIHYATTTLSTIITGPVTTIVNNYATSATPFVQSLLSTTESLRETIVRTVGEAINERLDSENGRETSATAASATLPLSTPTPSHTNASQGTVSFGTPSTASPYSSPLTPNTPQSPTASGATYQQNTPTLVDSIISSLLSYLPSSLIPTSLTLPILRLLHTMALHSFVFYVFLLLVVYVLLKIIWYIITHRSERARLDRLG